jgi:hypothetical protein
MAEGEGRMGGDWDPVSMRFCGFIQSLHQRRYLRRLWAGYFEVLWFYSVPPPTTILMETVIWFPWVFVVYSVPPTTILMETVIRFPWGFVVLFSPSTNDDTYGDCDPVSMRFCGFIQSLHQRRYLWRLWSGFHEVLWFYSVPPPTTILVGRIHYLDYFKVWLRHTGILSASQSD